MPNISKEKENEVILSYNNGEKSYNDVARECNINNMSVKNILKRNNVVLHNKSKFYRSNSLNESYFENIDTEAKAYFLGLILSDGCVYKRRFLISLQGEDKHILDSFREELQSTGNLYKRNPRNPTHKVQYSLEITSEKLVSDLHKLGIVERKSLVVEFPTINELLIPAFIRGIFDGDGSAYMGTRKNGAIDAKLQFIGSVPFITKLAEYFNEKNIHTNKVGLVNNGKNQVISFSSKENIFKLRELMYNNSTIYLFRKYNKLNEILEFFTNKKFKYSNEAIYQYSTQGVFLKKWDTLKDAEKQTNSNRQCILRCIQGKHKTANNYIWSITKT